MKKTREIVTEVTCSYFDPIVSVFRWRPGSAERNSVFLCVLLAVAAFALTQQSSALSPRKQYDSLRYFTESTNILVPLPLEHFTNRLFPLRLEYALPLEYPYAPTPYTVLSVPELTNVPFVLHFATHGGPVVLLNYDATNFVDVADPARRAYRLVHFATSEFSATDNARRSEALRLASNYVAALSSNRTARLSNEIALIITNLSRYQTNQEASNRIRALQEFLRGRSAK